jgi:hypothetical protein
VIGAIIIEILAVDLGSLPGAVIGVIIVLFLSDRFTRRPAGVTTG